MENSFNEMQDVRGYAPRRQYDGVMFEQNDAGMVNGQALDPAAATNSNNNSQPKARGSKKKNKVDELNAATGKLALEDALKLTDGNGMATKTPVSILQELLSRRGITPSYELVQIEGAVHEPTFRYRVSFNDKEVPFTAMGAGRSKKEAKHSAARALIDKLTGIQLPEVVNNTSNVANNNTGAMAASVEAGAATGSGDGNDKIVGNPIGWLQEMCMTRRWPPPTYETETEVGLPHERLFTIACTILSFREVGKGKSKKIAKRCAAHKMWSRLQENALDSAQIAESMRSDLEGDNRNCENYYGDLKGINVPTLTSQHSNKVSQFHKTLKNATGKKLIKLQKTCLKNQKLDFIKLLADIAGENQFEVTYVDIEEKTFNDKFQCLVQLSTLPVGVCHGSGDTAVEAQRMAAQNALEYLKIMTKK